jgi:site-specific recombinase XerC
VRRLIDVVSGKGLAPPTVASLVNLLSGLLRYGIRAGVVERNPVPDLDRDDRPSAKRQTEPRYLTSEQVTSLLGRMTDTFRPIAAWCALAWLRASESLGLTLGRRGLRRAADHGHDAAGRDGNRVPLKDHQQQGPRSGTACP